MELLKTGAYLVNGTEIIEDTPEAQARLQAVAGPDAPSKEEAAKGTIAYGILEAHNTSDNMEKLKIRFEKVRWNLCTSSSGSYPSVRKRNACLRWSNDSWF